MAPTTAPTTGPTTEVRLHGPAVDHPAWSAAPDDDGFDAEALERAMTEGRRRAYAALADIDAA